MIYCSKNYPLKQVNVSDLTNYLRDRGWIQEHFGRQEVLKFKSPSPLQGENYFEILIPSRRELFDYERMVENVITSVSAYEKRSFEDVLSQILSFGDILKFQISNSKTKIGNIPINDGIDLYQSVSDLIIYGACGELYPDKKSFPRKHREATDLIKNCQIGQSQYGSFIANIHYQLVRPPESRDLDLEMNPILPNPPLGRKTILRIFKGLENVRESIQIENPAPIINNYREGLNANMCDTLVEIIKTGLGSDINISANLEPAWTLPEINTNFILQPSSQSYLMEASDRLKGENPEERITLVGEVTLLRRMPEEENTIKILTALEDDIFVTIKLDAESYNMAITAHGNNSKIRITGILKKIGRIWLLSRPEGLEILP